MNSHRSLILFLSAIVFLGAVVTGFGKGVNLLQAGNTLAGIGLMLGSLVVAAIGVFLSYKLKR